VAKPSRPAAHDDADREAASESSLDVIDRARKGDGSAARELLERSIGPLRRWASRRLPGYARSDANTEDIVQDVVVRALGHIDRFDHRTVNGLRSYLRESVRNRIRDEIRRVSRRGVPEEVSESVEATSRTPLEEAILAERSEIYLHALRTLKPEERMAVIFRLEHGWSYDAIAEKLRKSSPDAARMAVTRAMKRLADAIGLAVPPS